MQKNSLAIRSCGHNATTGNSSILITTVSMLSKRWVVSKVYWCTNFKDTYFATWEGMFHWSLGIYMFTLFYRSVLGKDNWFRRVPDKNSRTLRSAPVSIKFLIVVFGYGGVNRANVYVGFQVQLDSTGILMLIISLDFSLILSCGHVKILTLKVSLIQISEMIYGRKVSLFGLQKHVS